MRNHFISTCTASRRLMAATTCAALLLSGCAGIRTTTGYYYPECNTYCASVEAHANDGQLVKSVAGGVVMGALSGAMVGLLSGRDYRSALIGAGVGGLVGGTAGYFYFKEKIKEYMDPRQRYESYLEDASTQKQALLALQRDVIASRNCYDEKWKEVIAEFDSGIMSKEEAEKRLKEINTGLEQVKEIIAKSKDDLIKQRKQTEMAMEEERKLQEEMGQYSYLLDYESQAGENQEPDIEPEAVEDEEITNAAKQTANQKTEQKHVAKMKQQPQQVKQNKWQGTKKPVIAQQQTLVVPMPLEVEQISEVEEHLDLHITEQEEALSALYDADKERETRRQQEASTRALEV